MKEKRETDGTNYAAVKSCRICLEFASASGRGKRSLGGQKNSGSICFFPVGKKELERKG